MKIEIDKPVVPVWFDDWYRVMKGAEHTDAFMLTVVLPVSNYGNYCDYSRDNCFFNKDEFTYISENFLDVINAIQFGYEVSEPVYYAKVKGWNLTNNKNVFWNYRSALLSPMLSRLYLGDKESNDIVKTILTKEEWNELGVNDTNADFEEV